MLVVPEEVLEYCAKQSKMEIPEEPNNFELCLDYGTQFKEAGLTPLYLCKENMKDIFVTSVEKFQTFFH